MAFAIHNLRKRYGTRTVVDSVSLEVKRGEIVGLLGPNGAGKTTTFYMCVGIVRPNGGQVILDDTDITHMPMHRRARHGIGYLAQEPSVFRKLSVEDNLRLILEMQPISRAEREKRIDELLERFGIANIRNQRGYMLSGGERRRVEIARTLANEPSFILLDEPFTGVDPIALEDIKQVVANLRSDGIGILLTDHSVRETLKITDRAYIMYDGKILTHGPSSELPSNPIARQFYFGERFSM